MIISFSDMIGSRGREGLTGDWIRRSCSLDRICKHPEAGADKDKRRIQMSLRKISKILGISPTYLSLLLNGKRPWRGNLKERYEELVNTFVNTIGSRQEVSSSASKHADKRFPAIKSWREREGVEPTAPTEGPGPTDLKSARPTGTHPLPRHLRSRKRPLTARLEYSLCRHVQENRAETERQCSLFSPSLP